MRGVLASSLLHTAQQGLRLQVGGDSIKEAAWPSAYSTGLGVKRPAFCTQFCYCLWASPFLCLSLCLPLLSFVFLFRLKALHGSHYAYVQCLARQGSGLH